MEEAKNGVYIEEQEKNPILLLISNLFGAIKLPFPPRKKNGGGGGGGAVEPPAASSSRPEEPTMVDLAEVRNEGNNKPGIVTFPKQSFVPLKLEVDTEVGDQTTNPLLLWQVYAIGGFYILRWAWKRWNEGKEEKKSDDNPPPAHE